MMLFSQSVITTRSEYAVDDVSSKYCPNMLSGCPLSPPPSPLSSARPVSSSASDSVLILAAANEMSLHFRPFVIRFSQNVFSPANLFAVVVALLLSPGDVRAVWLL